MMTTLQGVFMNLHRCVCAAALAAMLMLAPAYGRPILYAHSITVMAEYTADGMKEAQLLYAPTSRWSIGAGHLELEDTGPNHDHEVNFARVNFLVKRWNGESSQANIFAWGGVGRSSITIAPSATPDPGEHNHGVPVTPGQPRTFEERAWNSGAQIDYETRRLYFAASSDAHYSSTFLKMLGFEVMPRRPLEIKLASSPERVIRRFRSSSQALCPSPSNARIADEERLAGSAFLGDFE